MSRCPQLERLCELWADWMDAPPGEWADRRLEYRRELERLAAQHPHLTPEQLEEALQERFLNFRRQRAREALSRLPAKA